MRRRVMLAVAAACVLLTTGDAAAETAQQQKMKTCNADPTDQTDTDDDGVGDASDNCPHHFNPFQTDVCGGSNSASSLASSSVLTLKQVRLKTAPNGRIRMTGTLDTTAYGGLAGFVEALRTRSLLASPSAASSYLRQGNVFAFNVSGAGLAPPGPTMWFPACIPVTGCSGTKGESVSFFRKGATNVFSVSLTAQGKTLAGPLSSGTATVTLSLGGSDQRDQASCRADGRGNSANCRKSWCPSGDLCVSKSGSLNGNGSVWNPYRRITDAVVRARAERAAAPTGDEIRIHVAAGTYVGSFDATQLQNHPEYETLPIILNVPKLVVRGATVLARDAAGLATGSTKSATILVPDMPLDQNQNLFLVTRTTDGAVGNGVTIEGFVLDGKGEVRYPNLPVFVDRVSNFKIRNNLIQHGSFGVTTRLASGTIDGNLLMQNAEAGAVATGGSIAQPATVLVHANRVTGNGLHGIMTMATATLFLMDRGTNALEIEPLQTAFDRNDPDDLRNIPDTLAVTVSGNDFSHYSVFGIRLMAVIPQPPIGNCSGPLSYQTQDATQPLTAVLTANVLGNTFDGGGRWGLGMSPGFPCRNDPRHLIITFAGSFEGNAFAASGRPPALFTFTAWSGVSPSFGFARESSYQVTDADGDLAGFDYNNPSMDPLTGVVLNNTLTVNGVEVPHGTIITPAAAKP
jgi:hypothetical protein